MKASRYAAALENISARWVSCRILPLVQEFLTKEGSDPRSYLDNLRKCLLKSPEKFRWNSLSCEVHQMSKSNFKNNVNDILFQRLLKYCMMTTLMFR